MKKTSQGICGDEELSAEFEIFFKTFGVEAVFCAVTGAIRAMESYERHSPASLRAYYHKLQISLKGLRSDLE